MAEQSHGSCMAYGACWAHWDQARSWTTLFWWLLRCSKTRLQAVAADSFDTGTIDAKITKFDPLLHASGQKNDVPGVKCTKEARRLPNSIATALCCSARQLWYPSRATSDGRFSTSLPRRGHRLAGGRDSWQMCQCHEASVPPLPPYTTVQGSVRTWRYCMYVDFYISAVSAWTLTTSGVTWDLACHGGLSASAPGTNSLPPTVYVCTICILARPVRTLTAQL
jgi:hypothetical protein